MDHLVQSHLVPMFSFYHFFHGSHDSCVSFLAPRNRTTQPDVPSLGKGGTRHKWPSCHLAHVLPLSPLKTGMQTLYLEDPAFRTGTAKGGGRWRGPVASVVVQAVHTGFSSGWWPTDGVSQCTMCDRWPGATQGGRARICLGIPIGHTSR